LSKEDQITRLYSESPQQRRRHEFHSGGYKIVNFCPLNSYKLGATCTMLVRRNYAVNRKFKCLQYQLAQMITVPFARTKISHTNVHVYWNWYISLDYQS